MLRFKLHFEYAKDYNNDEVIIEGETIEEIQKLAKQEHEKRNPVYCWSEEI